MVKIPSQIKNMVEDYLTQEGRPFQDITHEEMYPELEFILKVGTEEFPVYVYLTKKRLTRVIIELPIFFHEKHVTRLESKNDVEWWNLVLKLNDRMALWGLDWNYEQSGKKITKLIMHDFIDVDVLSRDTFSHALTTCTVRYIHMVRTIGYLLTDEEPPSTNIGGTDNEGPYR